MVEREARVSLKALHPAIYCAARDEREDKLVDIDKAVGPMSRVWPRAAVLSERDREMDSATRRLIWPLAPLHVDGFEARHIGGGPPQ